jgi:adenylosuccinate lyase
MNREDAYQLVQSLAHQAWNREGGDFRALVAADVTVQSHLSPDMIAACFDPRHHLQHLDAIYQRLNI